MAIAPHAQRSRSSVRQNDKDMTRTSGRCLCGAVTNEFNGYAVVWLHIKDDLPQKMGSGKILELEYQENGTASPA